MSCAATMRCVARSHESLWLWTGAAFAGVGAALVGVAGGLDAASKVHYSFLTSVPMIVAYVMFGLAAVCLGCAVRNVRFPFAVEGGEGPGEVADRAAGQADARVPPVEDTSPRSGILSAGPRPTISSPQDRSEVDLYEEVSGTVTNLSPDDEVWIVVLPNRDGTYWPQCNLSKGHTGNFSASAKFGREKTPRGTQYALLLVRAPRRASELFRQFDGEHAIRGMRKLPGAEELTRVTVARR